MSGGWQGEGMEFERERRVVRGVFELCWKKGMDWGLVLL